MPRDLRLLHEPLDRLGFVGGDADRVDALADPSFDELVLIAGTGIGRAVVDQLARPVRRPPSGLPPGRPGSRRCSSAWAAWRSRSDRGAWPRRRPDPCRCSAALAAQPANAASTRQAGAPTNRRTADTSGPDFRATMGRPPVWGSSTDRDQTVQRESAGDNDSSRETMRARARSSRTTYEGAEPAGLSAASGPLAGAARVDPDADDQQRSQQHEPQVAELERQLS